jgi:hypothetical protein
MLFLKSQFSYSLNLPGGDGIPHCYQEVIILHLRRLTIDQLHFQQLAPQPLSKDPELETCLDRVNAHINKASYVEGQDYHSLGPWEAFIGSFTRHFS